MTLTAIEPDDFTWFPYKGRTFCLGVREGDAVWTSGQSAAVFDAQAGKSVVSGTMTEQAALSYRKLLEVVAAAGLGPGDVVHVTENVTIAGLADYTDAVAVRREIFGDHLPTVTTVIVDRLVRGRALLELELHAVPGGGTRLAGASAPTWSGSPVREGDDGEIHLPTILPLEPDGDVHAPGDLRAQYARCLAIVDSILEEAGLDAAQVVSCAEYVAAEARDALPATLSLRAAALGRETAGGTVVMSQLHRPGVMVAIDVVVSRRPKEVVDPGWPRFAGLPYVPAVRAGGTLYLSALSSADVADGTLRHPGDLAGQAEETYAQLAAILDTAGTTASEVRTTIEFCVSDRIGTYRDVAPVRERLLAPPWPASTGDLCTAFPIDGALLQTMAVAHVGR